MNLHNRFKPSALSTSIAAALFLMGADVAHSQTTPASPTPPETRLAPVVVTGNPLRAADVVAPVTVLEGDALVLRRGTTLGDTLNGLPGVSSSYFGPNANRPIIRGLDGDRVRILSNSGATVDASSLSFDHAVPIDPLVVERVEVVRGPAALLYGGSATGGVVNAIDNRIPKDKLTELTGSVEARVGGADSERGAGALLETGDGKFALHVDVFGRETGDLKVPKYVPVQDAVALSETRRLRNSASKASGGALGGSFTFDHGYLGMSVDTYDNKYGVVVEPDVTIRMKRDHVALAGEVRDLGGFVRTVRGQVGHTDYKHEELEGSGEVGTTFLSKGSDARIEAEHEPIGPFHGVFGAQLDQLEFSALGEEAFVPSTRTQSRALFVVEEANWSLGTTSVGVRAEHAKVKSDGDVDPGDQPFGAPSERRFSMRSASLSHSVQLSPQWRLTGTLSATERAPTYYELYANGVHVATSAFEIGNPNLPTERGNNIDLALAWKQGDSSARIGAYVQRFSRFIALDATGQSVNEIGEDGAAVSYPEYAFRSVRARLQGVELEGRHRMRALPWTIDLTSKLDFTRATNLDTGEPLARIAPLRATVGVGVSRDGWTAQADVEYAARQNRVPSTDVPTDGYSMLNVALSKHVKLGPSDALVFARITNLGNTLAYNAASIQTVRDLAPMGGRALKVGMKLNF